MADGFVVAAIVNEPAAVLDRFVGWYLGQGADRIELFFDDPLHPDIARFAALPRVTVTPCTAAFWASLGLSAEARFTRRQNAVLTQAYHALTEGWLLNVDADELMYAQGTSLAAWLAAQTEPQTLRVASAEQVLTEGPAQLFRLQIAKPEVNAIYGAEADLFRRRYGLIGHADGKSFHRAGRRDLRLRQHWAEDASGAPVEGKRLFARDGIHLLHYMAPDYAGWRRKLEWRLGAHGFPDPIKERLRACQASADPEAGFRALFDLLHAPGPDQIAALDAVGGILRLPADFAKPQAG
jgi:hypothetical protein